MSNFLSNLALRSLRPATSPDLLQPRLPSLFEAPNSPGQSAILPTESEVEKEAAQPKSAARPGLPTRAEKTPTSHQAVEPQQTILHRRDQEVSLSSRPAIKEASPPTKSPGVGALRTEPVSANEIQIRPKPHSVELGHETQAENKPTDHGLQPRLELIPTHPESKPATSRQPPVTTSALRSVPAEPEKFAERAPVVQIRIGRIEVRATTPAPVSPPRPTHRSPKLTLDDYLRQRNEGKR